MDPTLLMAGSFVVLLLLGVPVAVSIGFAAVVTMASANMPKSQSKVMNCVSSMANPI